MLSLISSEAEIQSLAINQIRRDGGTQPRTGVDEDTINDYVSVLASGGEFPAIDVMYDGKDYWLFDGFHRTEAHLRSGRNQIAAKVHRGSQEDAQWRSFGANKSHGLRRSNADKERAVRAALKHPRATTLSNVQIANHVGVDDKTIAKYRSEMESTSEIPRLMTRTGADGKERKAPVSPVYEPIYSLNGMVREWFTPEKGLSLIGSIYRLRAATVNGTAEQQALIARLEQNNVTFRKPDLIQAINNVRSQLEVQENIKKLETAQPEAFVPSPPLRYLDINETEAVIWRVARKACNNSEDPSVLGQWFADHRTVNHYLVGLKEGIAITTEVFSQAFQRICNWFTIKGLPDPTGWQQPALLPAPPKLPDDLTQRGWQLRQLGGAGTWYCINRDGPRSTNTHADPQDAITEAYSLQVDLKRDENPPTNHADAPVAVTWQIGSKQCNQLLKALQQRNLHYLDTETINALITSVERALGLY